ncbi:hypothetical protein K7432_003878 [Basidiobolus ranarum]|uniref:DUF7729 domain-containing protein n=1 Tax=Basidiobolus ranarum TaxID=34480 RepID=A0ABR2W5I8_9FUNG
MRFFTLTSIITSSLTLASAAPINPPSNGNIPLPSFKCLQVGLGVMLSNQDQGCLAASKVVPLLKQIRQNPGASQQQMSEVVDDICNAPVCTPDFLSQLQNDIQASCQGEDAQNPYVQAATALIRDYVPARDMLCLKDPSSNQYCSVEEGQLQLQSNPTTDPGSMTPPMPTKETCASNCGQGWLTMYNKYLPQHPDIGEWPFVSQLPTVCQAS